MWGFGGLDVGLGRGCELSKRRISARITRITRVSFVVVEEIQVDVSPKVEAQSEEGEVAKKYLLPIFAQSAFG